MKKIIYFLTFTLGLLAYSQNSYADTLTLGSLSTVQKAEQIASFRVGGSTEDSAQLDKTENSRSLPYSVNLTNNQVLKILGFLDLEVPKSSLASSVLFSKNLLSGTTEDITDRIELRVGSGSALILGNAENSTYSEFHVRANTKLIIEDGATLFIDEGSQIIVENGGALVIRSGAIIESVSPQSIQLDIGAEPCLGGLGDYDDIIQLSSDITFPPVDEPCDPIIFPPVADPNPSWVSDEDTTYVNRLVGIVGTNGAGGLQYQIGIEVPPGTAGVQPGLSVVYSSQQNSGILGNGVALSGLSSICRTGKNFYMDGEQSGIELDASDNFLLDGSRLISLGSALASTYGGIDIFDTENASFTHIIAFGAIDYVGAKSFQVKAKNGSTFYYGSTADSRIEFNVSGEKVVYQYLLSRYEDANGNYMDYVYTNSGGSVQIKEINYTGTVNFIPYNKISFTYINKPAPKTLYVGKGQSLLDNKWLSEITCMAEGAITKKYRFYYDNPNLRLDAVREFTPSDSMIGELRFFWKDDFQRRFGGNRRWIEHFYSGNPQQWRGKHPRLFGDMNGDGKNDIVGFATSHMEVSLSTGNSFGPVQIWYPDFFHNNQGWTYGRHSRHVLDMNGDGLADVVGFDDLGVVVGLNNGTAFYSISHWTSAFAGRNGWDNINKCPRHLVDFNGDGLPDVIGLSQQGVEIAINSGTNFHGGYITKNIFGRNQGWFYDDNDDNIPYNAAMSAVADINGDGKMDLIAIKTEGTSFLPKRFYILNFALSFGDSLGDVVQSVVHSIEPDYFWETVPKFNYFFKDVNGDGKDDYIYTGMDGILVSLSTGSNFTSSSYWTSFYGGKSAYRNESDKYQLNMADVNGDGMADLIGFDGKCVYVSLSTGSSFANPVSWNSDLFWRSEDNFDCWEDSEKNFRTIEDVTGDGLPDLVGFAGDGVYVSQNLSNDRPLLSQVRDDLGVQFTASYDLLTNSSIYTKAPVTSYPLLSFQGPMQVCTGIYGRSHDKRYTYEGAKIHYLGKGFLGFSKITETDNIHQTKTTSMMELNTTYWLNLPTQSNVFSTAPASGIELSSSQQSYTITHLGNKRIFPKLIYQKNTDKLTGCTSEVNLTYDANGNILSSAKKDSPPTSATKQIITTTTNTYASVYPYRLITTESKQYFNGSSQSYPVKQHFTYDAKGNMTKVIINYQTALACTTDNIFNAYGLMNSSTLSATGISNRTENYGYDNKGRFQTSVTTGLGTAYKSYNSIGQLLSETAIGGQTTTYGYNHFGQLVSILSPEGIQTTYKTIKDKYTMIPNAVRYTLEQTTGQPYIKAYVDILGRTIKTESPNPSGIVYTTFTYNKRGQVVLSSAPYYANETPKLTTQNYDHYGRLASVIYQNQTTTYGYNLLTTTVTNPANQTYSKTYDVGGNLVSATDPGGTINYTYDIPGYVKTITAPGGAVTQIAYDAYGRQTSVTDPNAGTIRYTYNVLGDILTQTDARGYTSITNYDAFGRISSVIDPNSDNAVYSYYENGPNKGLLYKINSYSGMQEYIYDNFGRVIQFNEDHFEALSTKYTYDTYGNLATYEYPSGFKLKYIYDSYGYNTEIRNASDNSLIWELKEVNASGQEIFSIKGPWEQTRRTYNDFGQPTDLGSYSYDNATGNMTNRYGDLITYDVLDRLTSYTDNLTGERINITYDANGNISGKTNVGAYTYHPTKKHAVTGVSEYTTSRDQEIGYNSLGKVDYIIEGNKTIQFSYGPTGELQAFWFYPDSRAEDFVERYYGLNYERTDSRDSRRERRYDPDGERYECECEDQGNDDFYQVIKEYIYSPFGLIGFVFDGYDVFYTSTDHLGSITKDYFPHRENNGWGGHRPYVDYTYDIHGRKYGMDRERFPCYSDQIEDMHEPHDLEGLCARHSYIELFSRGFTGHEHLDAFGLINMKGRLYDPVLGRMLSPDPYVPDATYTQDFNRYTYARNNPLSYIDPDGEFVTWSIIGPNGFSIGFNLTPIGVPLGAGINIGWSNGGSFGLYGEIGPRTGGSGITVSQSLDYGFGAGRWSTTTTVSASASYGFFNAGLNGSYTYDIQNGFGSYAWGVSGGINLLNSDAWGIGLNLGYGSGGWTYGMGGYYNPWAWKDNPIYEPEKWNNDKYILETNNCYSYGLDDIDNGNYWGLQPGDAGGYPITDYNDITLAGITARIISDGRIKELNFWNKLGFGKNGYYEVCLVIDEGRDYHFYRKDKGGSWSHKPGITPVINFDKSGHLITNPIRSNHGNYQNGIKILWVRRK